MRLTNKEKRKRLNNNENLKGIVFVLPLIIGLLTFFVIPVIKSFLFSIFNIDFGSNGYSFGNFAGLMYYKNALFSHTQYRQTVVTAMLNVIIKVPIIMVFSFFMASVLNNKFRGQIFFKVMMFIPIVTSLAASETTLETQMSGFSDAKETFSVAAVSFTKQISEYLLNAGVPENISSLIVDITDRVYASIGESGIQILIMIIGMCSISPLLYEAATVEGATAWESFWKITFPMAGPTIYVCLVYTIIDSFTNTGNGLMSLIRGISLSEQNYSLASAMGWIYFLIIAVLLGIISLIATRSLFYYDD